MNKAITCKLLVLASTILLTILMILTLTFNGEKITPVKETAEVIDLSDNTIVSMRISDLAELGSIKHATHIPDVYVKPSAMPGEIENSSIVDLDNSNHTKAIRGSYRFAVLHLDPNDTNFNTNVSNLSPYLMGDNQWHFSMQLPIIWSAATIYVNGVLVSKIGELKDYNYSDYSNHLGTTTIHNSGTRPVTIDLAFHTRRQSLPTGNPIGGAKIITIHYESDGYKIGGLSSSPLIGRTDIINSMMSTNDRLLSITVFVAMLAFVLFLFLCMLKRTLAFLPHQLIVLGIVAILLSALMLLKSNNNPYLWEAIKSIGFPFIAFMSVLCLRFKSPKKQLPHKNLSTQCSVNSPATTSTKHSDNAEFLGIGIARTSKRETLQIYIWICFAIFAAINFVISIPAKNISISLTSNSFFVATNIITGAMIFVLAALSINNKSSNPTLLIAPTLGAISIIASTLLPQVVFVTNDPLYWLQVAIVVVTIIVFFREFIALEKRNKYLTSNLIDEVSRQTGALRGLVADRDNLLRHISHDMKKPMRSISQFLSVLRDRERDTEQLKTIDIIANKSSDIIKEFTELSGYSKLNYAAEESTTFNVDSVLDKVLDNLNPDCIANGVIMNNQPSNILVFGKPKCLISIINNLVLNALEHSNCHTITLSAYKRKTTCYITVTDDGDGIEDGKDIFRPYYSDNNDQDNVGLGLYICRTLTHSMGGDLSYHQANGILTFTISLPIV